MDIVYFYCHIKGDRTRPGLNAPVIGLGQEQVAGLDIRFWTRGLRHGRHPLVVINGCRSFEVASGSLYNLIDPFIDRLTVISGAVVCWSFELLPRWALIVLALREIAMLCLGEYGLKHGVDIAINWPGRIGVFWIMAGLFFAMVFAGWVPVAFFFFGLAMSLLATVLYARTGILAVRAAKAAGTAKRSPRG